MTTDPRQGTVKVSRDLIEKGIGLSILEALQMRVLIADPFDYSRTVNYKGWSPFFETLAEGQAIPEYSPELEQQLNDGEITIYITALYRLEPGHGGLKVESFRRVEVGSYAL